MLPRLVATDLDGTLLRSDGSISPRTRQVLLEVEAAGVEVVFVTGRPLRWAREVFGHVGGHGEAIVSNGALVWDVASDGPLLTRAVPRDVVLEVARRLRDTVPGTTFALESLAGIALEHGFLERYPLPEGSARGDLPDITTHDTVKILARHEELQPQEFWDLAEECVGDLVEVVWSSGSTLLEMSAHGVTKASTLAVLAEQRGVGPDQVIAFGDMPNDLPMLAWAGTSYAMANAHPTVQQAADHVCGSNDDDGVAEVLEELLTRLR